MTDNDPNIWREVFGPLGQVIAFFGGAPRRTSHRRHITIDRIADR